jgi:hypothetical protein
VCPFLVVVDYGEHGCWGSRSCPWAKSFWRGILCIPVQLLNFTILY